MWASGREVNNGHQKLGLLMKISQLADRLETLIAIGTRLLYVVKRISVINNIGR